MAVSIDSIRLTMQFRFEMYLLALVRSQNVVFSLDEIINHIKLPTTDPIQTFDEWKICLDKHFFSIEHSELYGICFLVSECLKAREL